MQSNSRINLLHLQTSAESDAPKTPTPAKSMDGGRTVELRKGAQGYGITLTPATATTSNNSIHRHGVFVTHVADARQPNGEVCPAPLTP